MGLFSISRLLFHHVPTTQFSVNVKRLFTSDCPVSLSLPSSPWSSLLSLMKEMSFVKISNTCAHQSPDTAPMSHSHTSPLQLSTTTTPHSHTNWFCSSDAQAGCSEARGNEKVIKQLVWRTLPWITSAVISKILQLTGSQWKLLLRTYYYTVCFLHLRVYVIWRGKRLCIYHMCTCSFVCFFFMHLAYKYIKPV